MIQSLIANTQIKLYEKSQAYWYSMLSKKKKGIIDYRKVQNHVANKKQNMKVITESKIW